jgi:hypothetical protein
LETNARGQTNLFTIDGGTPFNLIQGSGTMQTFPLNSFAEFDRNEFQSNEFGLQRLESSERNMRTLTEEDIRTRACKLWKAAGEPNTKMDAFWYLAEKELLADRESENSAPNVPRRRATRRRRNAVPMAH